MVQAREVVDSGVVEVLIDQYQNQDRTRYRLATPSGLTKSSTLPRTVTPENGGSTLFDLENGAT